MKNCERCGEKILEKMMQEIEGCVYCDACYQRVKAEKKGGKL